MANMKNDRSGRGPDLNIEDTGRLITKATRTGRGKRIAIIAAALIVVAAVAVIGLRNNGERRYEEQVRLAEAAFAEGDYERAEEYYLAAIEMNDRKVEAREGLAYTKSVQGDHDGAIEIYEKLKTDTGDPDGKYQDAIEHEKNGETSRDPDLMIGADYDIVTGECTEEMEAELEDFLTLCCYYYMASSGWSDEELLYSYDSSEAADCGILNAIMGDMAIGGGIFDDYPDAEYAWVTSGDEPDPRGMVSDPNLWAGYTRANAETVNWIAKNLFNASDEEISRELEIAEELEMTTHVRAPMYLSDGVYYQLQGYRGDSNHIVWIQDITADAEYFDVTYSKAWYLFEGDYSDVMMMHARLQYKIIDGKGYWSVYTISAGGNN